MPTSDLEVIRRGRLNLCRGWDTLASDLGGVKPATIHHRSSGFRCPWPEIWLCTYTTELCFKSSTSNPQLLLSFFV